MSLKSNLERKVKGFLGIYDESTRVQVVVIDSDEIFLEVLRHSFASREIEFVGLKSGKAALDYFKTFELGDDITIVLLEQLLSDMNGIDILDLVIEKYEHRIPVVMLTDLASEIDIVRGFQRGAIQYIIKPVNLRVLIENVLSFAFWWRTVSGGE